MSWLPALSPRRGIVGQTARPLFLGVPLSLVCGASADARTASLTSACAFALDSLLRPAAAKATGGRLGCSARNLALRTGVGGARSRLSNAGSPDRKAPIDVQFWASVESALAEGNLGAESAGFAPGWFRTLMAVYWNWALVLASGAAFLAGRAAAAAYPGCVHRRTWTIWRLR